ncbi:MAG: hypothetical protein WC188_03590 [Candidatus Caldatribacteriota bacterium]|jgi:hypothetical protein
MLSIYKLFEAVSYAPRAQNPMAGVQDYVSGRLNALKQAFKFGRLSAAEFRRQSEELRKNRYNKQMGTTQF